jgi:hypothetical protein
MRTFTRFVQVPRESKRQLEWLGLRRYFGRQTASPARTSLNYGVLVTVCAVATFLSCALFSDQRADSLISPRNVLAEQPRSMELSTKGGEVLYVHDKLMQVAKSNSGVAVLRFVECRHYPKEHMKLAQVGLTSAGNAVLRLIAGDRCLFAPKSPVLDAQEYQQPRRSGFGFQPEPANHHLTDYQRYACEKFGSACPIALAIQLAENPAGACEVYHYNSSDGSLDWGYFQINTVHLTRRGLNLRDLLDCKANIDFAYQLFREEGFEAWTTYVNGAYRRYLFNRNVERAPLIALEIKSMEGGFLRSGADAF